MFGLTSSKALIEVGIALLIIAVILLVVVSPYSLQSTLSKSIKKAEVQMNKTTMKLLPNKTFSIYLSGARVLIYNSSYPLKIRFNNGKISQAQNGNVYAIATSKNGTLVFINNYTVPLYFSYAILSLSILPAYISFVASFFLGLMGAMVTIYGLIRRFRERKLKKRMQPPMSPPKA